MSVITTEIVRLFLREYMDTQSGDKLVAIRKCLATSKKVEDLSDELAESLHLADYQLTKNLHELILEEFDKLVKRRCLQGELTTEHEHKCIQQKIKLKKNEYIGILNETPDMSSIKKIQFDTSYVVLEYADYLFEVIRNDWFHNVKITPKIADGTGFVTLVVEQEALMLSKCIEQVEVWLTALGEKLKEVHFVARELFHIDCSLENGKWHGINIIVICGKVQCTKSTKIIWDLCGSSGGEAGENGGSVTFIANEIGRMNSIRIICNGGSPEKDNSSIELQEMLLGLLPPSSSSHEMRKMVFENAIKFGGNPSQFLYEPQAAYDKMTGKLTGHVQAFYMESERDGLKIHVGFRNGYMGYWDSILLIQRKKCSAGKSGKVRFIQMEAPNDTIPPESFGVQVSTQDGQSNNDTDIGYMEPGPKQLVEYTGKRYELKMNDISTPESIYCKLLGKYLKICENTDTLSSTRFLCPVVTNPDDILKTYGKYFDSTAADGLTDQLIVQHESQWWTKKIMEQQ